MTKEQLLELKQKIDNLTREEQLQRDCYLDKIARGEILGPQTGYPSIDKPQIKYYRKTPIKDLSGVETIYDMIFKDCNLEDDAITFLDGACNWTFKKLKKTTDKYIDAFKRNNIGENDEVLIGATNTPELVAVLIALVSIGASSKFFDIRASEAQIADYANSSKCKAMVCFDKVVLPKVQKVIDQTGLEKVFILRGINSLSFFEKAKVLYKNRKEIINRKRPTKEEKITDDRFVELLDLFKSATGKDASRVAYDEKRPAIKVQSSGTTGKAKTIVHSEKSAVEFAKSISYTDLPLGRGKTVLVALPPWIAYGIGDAILMSLALGSKVALCADFESNAVYRNIGKFTLSYAAPFHYRHIREHYDELSDDMKAKLSKVDCMITGGDKYSAGENEADEKLFGTIILNGYGNNEVWGALSVNPLHHNRYGSVGIPKYGEATIIYDNERDVELPYGERGEVCTVSPTSFLEYEGNEEATKKVIKLHDDGKYYIHMGDFGYMDKDGFIFLDGRSERVITRLGFKISAYTIEDAILSIPCVNECIVVEVPDKEEEHVPMAFVVLNKDLKLSASDAENIIITQLGKILKSNETPKYIQIVDKMKYTPNNKYDFREYERIGKEYVEERVSSQVQKKLKK